MIAARTRQRLHAIRPVPDGIADSDVMLDAFRRLTLDNWRERVADLPGAVVVGDPEVTTSDNMRYGCEILDADDNPYLDDDGRPVLDLDRLVMFVVGWVDLPQDVWERSVAEDEARRVAALAAFAERQQ